MRIFLYILGISVLFIGGCSSGESFYRFGYDFDMVDHVAIVTVEGTLKSEPARDQIADLFAMELLKKGYAPVGRTQVKAYLKEQQLDLANLITAEGATSTGQILNVPVVLVVNIPQFGEQIAMVAQMVDVENGSVLWIGKGLGRSSGPLSSITGVFSGGGVGGEGDVFAGVGAGGVGGVLGGMTGGVLSPQEVGSAQKVIKKMCRSLPSKLPEELEEL